jgi:hypothetical protein
MSDQHEDEAAQSEQEPSSQEFAAAFVQHLGRTPVRDLIIQAMATMADAAGIRLGLGPEGLAVADLAQARTAIEVLRGLVAVADQELGTAAIRPFREPLAQLQLAYAKIAEANPGAVPAPPVSAPEPESGSRLWVPPGGRTE